MKNIYALLVTILLIFSASFSYAADAKISALTEVTAPATTDSIPILSSATTKRFQIINFPLFTGYAGGQTIKGGTGTTDDLIFVTTAGVGASGADMIFKTGNNGATEAMRIYYDGSITVISSILSVGAAGVKFTGDGDGAITLLGLGNGFDEDLTFNFDDTENTVGVTSSTGVTSINFGSIGVTANVTGNATTATDLAADPANCAAGEIALGITAAGVAECTATPSGLTSVESTIFTGALIGNASTVGYRFAGAPDANDDTPTYAVGDEWIDTTTGCKHIAKVVTDGAAVWVNQCLPPLPQNYFLVGGSSGYAEATNVLPLTSISDDVYFSNAATPSKQMEFDLAGITTSTKRTLTPKDANYTIGEHGVIPSGTAPTVDAAGEIAEDTTASQIVYGASANVLDRRRHETFVVKGATTADDFIFLKAPYGMTITAINCIATGSTNVVGQLQECTSAGASCTDLDADITCDTDGAADDGTLTDSTIASGGWLAWKTTSVSGTNTFLTVTVTYTIVRE